MKKKILLYICVFCLFFTNISSILASEAEIETIPVSAEVLEGVQVQEVQNPEIEVDNTADLGITAVSCILMEASTGKVIYEKNADQALSPASITKIMTLILIFDALKDGKIKLDDEVTTSAYAKSMGGSQVFLEEGEKQTVETLIKCIVVASGNDASVAMAEYICGSEAEFVRQMNERAKGLGMTSTHFEDCCGLTDSTTHVSSARDVALMSRELITKYPEIHQYSTIWMENITHVTAKGTSEFGLANTNKLLKQYQWCNGLKTGSTSLAKYCLSATALKDGIELVAVIMAAPDYKARFSEARTLLDYGYGICKLYQDENMDILPDAIVLGGVKESVSLQYESGFTFLSTDGSDVSNITKQIQINDQIQAPVTEGEVAGKAIYYLEGEEIGSVNLLFKESIKKAGFFDYFKKIMEGYLL
ncbi:MAG: D-alanyl-D-alanine carboxypeptidase [Lachnospiraceae bacterium]|jgi:D-alanyl-D-alanine carboxypeptidase (penicillin-binding protein 5/6)|nr:D-alanyl-D-alanine carboxypeptidase [Lachnospiraceae bacterium]